MINSISQATLELAQLVKDAWPYALKEQGTPRGDEPASQTWAAMQVLHDDAETNSLTIRVTKRRGNVFLEVFNPVALGVLDALNKVEAFIRLVQFTHTQSGVNINEINFNENGVAGNYNHITVIIPFTYNHIGA